VGAQAAVVSQERVLWAARERLVRGAREHFHKFGAFAVRDDVGNPMRYHHVHLWWIAHINYAWSRGMHAGIFAPFGHGKTSSLIVPLAAYLTGINQQERIKVICSGDDAAKLRMQASKRVMESPLYNLVFPEVVPGNLWTDHKLLVERVGHAVDPTVEARGVKTMGTGSRATTMIFDDVVDAENSTTEEKRNHTTWLVEVKWLSRLEPGGKVVWIATPWDGDDASYKMRARPDFCWLEQRVKEDLSGYEQDAHNVGRDYLEECSRDVAEMLADP